MKVQRKSLNQLDSIIWLQTAFLGDLVLSTGAFDLVKKEAPQLRQLLITSPVGHAALNGHKSLTKTLVIEKRRANFLVQAFRLRKKLMKMGLSPSNSVIIQLHRSTRSTIISKLLGYPVVSYEESSFSKLASWKVKRVAVFHECTRNALPLEQLGVKRTKLLSARPSLSPEQDSSLSELIKPKAYRIAIAPGSVWQTKKWPIQKFCDLIDLLLNQPGIQLVLIGSKSEVPLLDSIKKNRESFFREGKLLNLIGKTSLDDLRFVYPQLNLLISNDSSPIHYASAFNIPTIAIFGATVSSMGFGPLAEGSQVIERKSLSCRPCSAHGPNKCPLKHFKCMEDIKAEEVYQQVLKYLPKDPASKL